MNKKVIVTGANGFIGSSLICKLVENDIQVIAIDCKYEPSHLPENALITKIVMDLNEIDALEELVSSDDYYAFYHFAWRGVNGSDKGDPVVQSRNVETTLRCALMAKKLGCRKYLCAGTVAELSVHSLERLEKTSGGMMYGVAKHCAHLLLETYCKNIGIPFVWMQFSNIYGPDNKTGNLVSYTISELLADREATFGPAMQPYDFVFIDDLIEAVYRLGECESAQGNYLIGSGHPRILKEYLLEIGKACNREGLIQIGTRPDDGIRYTMEMFDNSPLINLVGNYVSRSFHEGIRYTIEHY